MCLLDDLADAVRRRHAQGVYGIADNRAAAHHRRLRMRKLPLTAAEDLLEIIMRRYERAPVRC